MYTNSKNVKKNDLKKREKTSPIVERMCLCYLALLLNARLVAGIFCFLFKIDENSSFFLNSIAALSCWPRRCRRLKTQVFYIDAKAFQLGFVSSVFTIALHQQQFSRLNFFSLSLSPGLLVHSQLVWRTEL